MVEMQISTISIISTYSDSDRKDKKETNRRIEEPAKQSKDGIPHRPENENMSSASCRPRIYSSTLLRSWCYPRNPLDVGTTLSAEASQVFMSRARCPRSFRIRFTSMVADPFVTSNEGFV